MNFFEENEEILVSVIIPCYNSEKYIIRALESLEKQKLDKFEVIIINDGSIDDTDKIITKYLKSSRLNSKYIIQENAGVSKARNIGLNNAVGKYIAFLDSDDIYNSNFILELSNCMLQRNVDTVYCSYSRNIKKVLEECNSYNNDLIRVLSHEQLMNNFMYRKGPCGFFNFIYKKSIIDEYKIRFNEYSKYGEDLEFTWKYLCHCRNGIFLDKSFYGYYNNPDSAVNNISWRITDVLYSIKRVEKYIINNSANFNVKFKNYMYHRTLWAIAKEFAKADRYDLFKKLVDEYDLKNSSKYMIKNSNNILIIISSIIIIISPKIFFKCIKNIYGLL